MENLKNYLTSNQATALYWQFGNLVVLLLIGLVSETGFYPAILLPLLNSLTKLINTNYLQK